MGTFWSMPRYSLTNASAAAPFSCRFRKVSWVRKCSLVLVKWVVNFMRAFWPPHSFSVKPLSIFYRSMQTLVRWPLRIMKCMLLISMRAMTRKLPNALLSGSWVCLLWFGGSKRCLKHSGVVQKVVVGP